MAEALEIAGRDAIRRCNDYGLVLPKSPLEWPGHDMGKWFIFFLKADVLIPEQLWSLNCAYGVVKDTKDMVYCADLRCRSGPLKQLYSSVSIRLERH
jgi:hypothetical protein